MKSVITILLATLISFGAAVHAETYAEKLGFPKGARVAIFHSDDLGMFYDSNEGTQQSVENGIVTSASTMMPTGWVTHWAKWLKENPDFDNGLHLTLTSEWGNYRWGPIAGPTVVPGLVDPDGHMWHTVAQVAKHATPEEVGIEINAQIAKARGMGIPITHMDTHMGTLYETPEFLATYCDIGIKEQIPVMIMGGHMTVAMQRYRRDPSADERKKLIVGMANRVWDAGLPVLDDLYTEISSTRDFEKKIEVITKAVTNQEPGLTMYIVHCTDPKDTFRHVSASGPNRDSDRLAMQDPRIKKLIKDQGIILTTWKEIHERRKKLD
ncbi:MAG: polysaccharide deacetylase family protein [Candidatus Hydrogenedentota bacterium]